jgi:hypothetical protein
VKLTLIWQSASYVERNWIREILRPITADEVIDEKHRLVLGNCILIDSYLHGRPRDYYKEFQGKNAWLLHMGDETYEGGYDRYDCFRGVLRSYWSSIFNPRRVLQIPVGYSAGTELAPALRATERPYLWSFAGGAAKSSRPEMIKAFSPIRSGFVHATDAPNARPIPSDEYQQILHQSVFAPSAMGNVNLECYRPYEALQRGAVPILEKRLGLDYFTKLLGKHPMPTFFTWRDAARFVASMQGDHAAQDHLIAECSDWWIGYKRNLSARIAQFVQEPHGADLGSAVHWSRSIPGSQVFELLRHHSVPATLRRAKRMALRIANEGKLRKTAGV